MSEYKFVTVENKDNGVSIISINREDKRNALNTQIIEELRKAFLAFDADESRRVAVLTGKGDAAFSAGADLLDMPAELWRGIPTVGFQTDKPIIAAVSGWCIGGALVLAMMTDLIVASESAKFYYPEAKVGFTGGIIAGLAYRLPHHVAMEVVLLCRVLNAQRAHQLGFVNQVVPVGQQVDAAVKMADEMAEMAPMVLHTLKRFINQDVVTHGPSEKMARTLGQLKELDNSYDTKEGLNAFKEKRAPVFLGR